MPDLPAVEVENLAVRFQQRDRTIHAVNDVSFRLARGEVLGILGERVGETVPCALMRLRRKIVQSMGGLFSTAKM